MTLRWIRKNWFALAMLLCYLWISVPVALRHEMWRDEAQAWLIVRDLSL